MSFIKRFAWALGTRIFPPIFREILHESTMDKLETFENSETLIMLLKMASEERFYDHFNPVLDDLSGILSKRGYLSGSIDLKRSFLSRAKLKASEKIDFVRYVLQPVPTGFSGKYLIQKICVYAT